VKLVEVCCCPRSNPIDPRLLEPRIELGTWGDEQRIRIRPERVLRIPRSPLQSRQHSREATRTNEPRHGCSQRSDSNCPGTFRGRATIGDLLCKTKRRAEGLGESLERRQLAPYNSESHFDFGEGLLTAEHTFDHGVGEMNWARSLDPSRRKEREQLSNAWVMKKHAKQS
jgi:hypothetical protein